MSNFWQRLDPRRHLAAAIGWAVFLGVTAFAVGSAGLAADEAESRVRADAERTLAQVATQIGRSLAFNLRTRQSILLATAAQLDTGPAGDPSNIRRQLDAVQRQFPEIEWLGVADAGGHVVAATGPPRAGADVVAEPWFRLAIAAAATDAAPSGPRAVLVRPVEAEAQAPRRVILFAAPLAGSAGVLGGFVGYDWIEQRMAELLSSFDGQRGLQLLAASADGIVQVGPANWIGRALDGVGDPSEGGRFVFGRNSPQFTRADEPAWTIVVRQDAATALAPARATERTVFLSVLGAGVLSAAFAVWIVRVLIRRLERLAVHAQALQRGDMQLLAMPAGHDEVSRIGAILADVVARLQHEKRALVELNADLDRRVAQRTERIERMADDARHAAVTRERLRLARDLHDTLAHSLMALLTQVRMIRKLRARWSDGQIEDELARAEAVAASGLADARAAINQMRHNGVREVGLGAALAGLIERFRARSGLSVRQCIEPAAGGLANERAEIAFRIVEEALRNVERHASASSVELRLESVEAPGGGDSDPVPLQRVRLAVTDDGVGFDPTRRPQGHYGLRGMQEQAHLVGARLELRSASGQGSRVEIEFDAWER